VGMPQALPRAHNKPALPIQNERPFLSTLLAR